MKDTAKQRIEALEAWLRTQPIGPITRDAIIQTVEDIVELQDRDTRHACADAINAAPRHSNSDDGDPLISIHDAHRIVMNIQSI